jgi:hypothetical protein
MRRDQQAIDLFVGVVRKREYEPVGDAARGAGADLDTPDNAVGTRRGRNLEAIAFGDVALRPASDRRGHPCG